VRGRSCRGRGHPKSRPLRWGTFRREHIRAAVWQGWRLTGAPSRHAQSCFGRMHPGATPT
jgi:hypothetical protein